MNNGSYACGRGTWRQQGLFSAMPVNISKTDEAFIINLYAPDLQKNALSITTKNDILTIRYNGGKETVTTYTRREYRAEEINRSFDLKGKVAIDKIKATYTEGVLRINLPKTDAAKHPLQEIPVQ